MSCRRIVAPQAATRLIGLALARLWSVAAVGLVAQTRRDFDVSAQRYSFTVSGTDSAEMRVTQDDLVNVTFSAEDIPHSFTVLGNSPYRIDRRAEPGKPVTFEFRADPAGTFEFCCSLTIDPALPAGDAGRGSSSEK